MVLSRLRACKRFYEHVTSWPYEWQSERTSPCFSGSSVESPNALLISNTLDLASSTCFLTAATSPSASLRC